MIPAAVDNVIHAARRTSHAVLGDGFHGGIIAVGGLSGERADLEADHLM